MKKYFRRFFAALSICVFFASCLKPNHSIRINNSYYEQLNDVKVGNANFGSVSAGETTGYKSIPEGNFSLSGYTATGNTLSGGGSVSGKGTHKWTITISAAGTVSLKEDK